jgi:ribonuclease HI
MLHDWQFIMTETFHIFTDGSAIRNPGQGGWAAVLINGGKKWEIKGSNPWTTISEMELVAAVEALRSIPAGTNVNLYSDSELLVHGMLFHIGRWQEQGWRNSRGLPLQHQKLWRDLLAMTERMNIHWQWIRGHSRHPMQNHADELAYQAARSHLCNQRMVA